MLSQTQTKCIDLLSRNLLFCHPLLADHGLCYKWQGRAYKLSLATQVVSDKSRSNEFRNFLDNSQYNMNGILRYERIFGDGFVSTGGADTTKVRPAASLDRASCLCAA